ncbi:MAG: Hsp20/alpha crystallin family protein [Cyanobacteria bacterium SIG27]|nr:Hsp20/alpha crystallin family protein [Cyanobacteria bacterium SIG27]
MRFSVIKRDPSYFFENIHEDLNRFLKDTFGDIEFMDKSNMQLIKAFRPAVEIKEKSDQYKIKVELPNVDKEHIDVELTKNSISIKAESKFEECKNDENLRTSEFRYGKFTRVIPLEHEINPDEAKSEFKNGILHIELPKIHQDNKDDVKKLTIN